MIVTGIAPPPLCIQEKSQQASLELVFLAVRALEEFKTTRLITNLAPGWDQALAKAALEHELPYIVTVPSFAPGGEVTKSDSPYRELLGRGQAARKISTRGREVTRLDEFKWRVRQADLVLVLWDFDYEGEIFQVVRYAIEQNKAVINLWRDWESILRLRRNAVPALLPRRSGAQIFENKPARQNRTAKTRLNPDN